MGLHHCNYSKKNNNESWLNNVSDGENQASYAKKDKCPTDVLQKFRRYESVNLIRLKQTSKLITYSGSNNARTGEAIKRAKKDFSTDLHFLVDETARDAKILNAISAIETDRIDDIF